MRLSRMPPTAVSPGWPMSADLEPVSRPCGFRVPVEGASDYLMTTLVATPERFGMPDEELFTLSAEELWKITVDLTSDWHPAARELFTHADPDTFFPIAIRAGERVEPWTSGPVTLLGDAIHTMPPTGGVGANTALEDSATLAGELLSAARRDKSLIEAAVYERVMLPRGFLPQSTSRSGWPANCSAPTTKSCIGRRRGCLHDRIWRNEAQSRRPNLGTITPLA
jgi:2-polyprenyl-6-methoxyphenol hydroxylase-like FAD-dependent oxidoreductase